ncbi:MULTISPECIES: hypothetical protein [Cysteiniphilum]|uniref:hypothetical protein n=1 Tax=Cysteiniphilum TaxID=2056696 RepID=UPI0017821493|nr:MULTISPECIES: hypothetical protein [Cysteiniphilum]
MKVMLKKSVVGLMILGFSGSVMANPVSKEVFQKSVNANTEFALNTSFQKNNNAEYAAFDDLKASAQSIVQMVSTGDVDYAKLVQIIFSIQPDITKIKSAYNAYISDQNVQNVMNAYQKVSDQLQQMYQTGFDVQVLEQLEQLSEYLANSVDAVYTVKDKANRDAKTVQSESSQKQLDLVNQQVFTNTFAIIKAAELAGVKDANAQYAKIITSSVYLPYTYVSVLDDIINKQIINIQPVDKTQLIAEFKKFADAKTAEAADYIHQSIDNGANLAMDELVKNLQKAVDQVDKEAERLQAKAEQELPGLRAKRDAESAKMKEALNKWDVKGYAIALYHFTIANNLVKLAKDTANGTGPVFKAKDLVHQGFETVKNSKDQVDDLYKKNVLEKEPMKTVLFATEVFSGQQQAIEQVNLLDFDKMEALASSGNKVAELLVNGAKSYQKLINQRSEKQVSAAEAYDYVIYRVLEGLNANVSK